ncbi:hypothetical protein [Paraburkholderia ribeironis]|uniref:hypothetical protein n=1 Tax=Paraburkholderia ribeironis TaxID=1247936 RepID=UPI001FECBEB5|nr:hypothetical protein [Paraburkholderia ribeironis]
MHEIAERHADDLVDVVLPAGMLQKCVVDEHHCVVVEQHRGRGQILGERAELGRRGAAHAAPHRPFRAEREGEPEQPACQRECEGDGDIEKHVDALPRSEPRQHQPHDQHQ